MLCSKCGQKVLGPGPCPCCAGPPAASQGAKGGEAPASRPPTNGLAIASLVLGILGLCTVGITGLIGLVLGIIAAVQISRNRESMSGEGLAVAGIVVSGISVLMLPIMAAVLFPVFSRARENARLQGCLANQKQLAMGVMMYVQDYDEHHPPANRWCDLLSSAGYVRQSIVFRCPSIRQERSGYAYNSRLSRKAAATIRYPATTVLTFDAPGGWNRAGGPELAQLRHNRGLAASFLDGHSQWIPGVHSASWDPSELPRSPAGSGSVQPGTPIRP